jgi:hypothetical protein
MKNEKISFLVFFFIAAIILSCNESGRGKNTTLNDSSGLYEKISKSDTTDVLTRKAQLLSDYLDEHCVSAGGMANFIISETNARLMTDKFDEIYGLDSDNERINALERNYYVDACTIRAIATFLQSEQRYDGIRIHFAAATINNPTSYPKRPYQNKTALYFYPTQRSTVSGSTQHNDRTSILIPLPSCAVTRNYIKPFAPSATNEIAVFKSLYYQRASTSDTTNKILSKGVWIDSCVVNAMAKAIDLSGGSIEGINIKTAAYLGNESNPPLGKTARNQSTFIFVPVVNGVDNWKILNKLIGLKEMQWKKRKEAKSFINALNHGELCPSRCGDE